MKKLATLLGIMSLVGAIAVPVLAQGPGWGMGRHMGIWGSGPGYAPGPGNTTLTEEQRTQLDTLYQKFYDDTAELRDEILAKSRELNTTLNASELDADKAKALQKEISELSAKLAQERLNFRLEVRKIVPEARFGKGYGWWGFRTYRKGVGPGMDWGLPTLPSLPVPF